MSSASPPGSLLAARTPRVEVAPSYADSYGPEAAELMAAAAKPLDQWQRDSAHLLLATRADGRWACVEYCELVARQNGKGGVLEARVLVGFLLLGERRIMWSAHEVKTSYDAFIRLQELFQAMDHRSDEEKGADENLILVDGQIPIKVVNTNGREGFVRLDTKQRIRFIARSKSSGRGMTGDVNIIDETFAYTAAQHAALFPTMMARPNPQIIYTSTPPLDSASGDILHNLRARAEAILEALREGRATRDNKLGYRDWGLDGDLDHLDRIDLDDQTLWPQPNPSMGGRISVEIIEQARISLPTLEFAREVLCIWPRRRKSRGGVIDMDRWNGPLLDERVKAGLDPTPMVGRVALGVGVSLDRSSASVGAAGRRPDELLAIERVEGGTGTRWLIPFVKKVVAAQNPVALVYDPSSPAGAFAADFEELVKGTDTVLMQVTARDNAQASGALMNLMEAEQVRHIGQTPLTLAAEGATTRPLGDAWAWDRRNPTVDVTSLDAVTLALHGFREHEHDDSEIEPWIYFEGGEDDE